jgi:hypothetical protein
LLGRTGAVVPLLHGDRRTLAPSRAGRRVLCHLRTHPASGDTEAIRVALGGREQMTDERLRAAIFERPDTMLPPARTGRRSRGIDHSDPRLAAYRTGGTAAAAGTYITLDGGF